MEIDGGTSQIIYYEKGQLEFRIGGARIKLTSHPSILFDIVPTEMRLP